MPPGKADFIPQKLRNKTFLSIKTICYVPDELDMTEG